ncbi:MAG: hypothetical protein KME12_08785 [Trichocoleus desertorum ATA4-8-CV12]|jgi:hypothetical protein|nr:hypothetical protein [Trichocoleus desertorum ATA4-8-CV12]
MKPEDEFKHLQYGAGHSDGIEGVGLLLFKVYCQGNSNTVLKNAREVLEIVLQQYDTFWLSEEDWRGKLPFWFVTACAPERSLAEVEEDIVKWRALSSEEQQCQAEEESWSVMEWISWFEPSDDPFNQRTWFWWDASIKDPDLLVVTVEVVDIPVPLGALLWLLKASGALKIEEAEKDDTVSSWHLS